MDIREATIKALENNCFITTVEWKDLVKIKPTNDSGNCIIMTNKGENPSTYGWQPCADDLIRIDWIITE